MHHIYHTRAIILRSGNVGEAGKYYVVFTREMGLIYASAQGVRKLSSKLRFVLQEYSLVNIDFVRGKDFWRITSASKTGELEGWKKDTDKTVVVANVSRLLKKLLAGEEPNALLFDEFVAGISVIEECKNHKELKNAEMILVLRILYYLGYVGEIDFGYLVSSPFEKSLVHSALTHRAMALSVINRAIKESQM